MGLHGKPLAFIGPMGSGKSSLARRAAAKHGGTVFDTDREFVSRYGDISAFFAAKGEAEFRRIEGELLSEAAVSGCEYIATGGGAVLNKRGMAELIKHCDIVYLSAPVEVLKARIANSNRPLKNKLEDVMRERAPLYERYADYVIDTTDSSLPALEDAMSRPRKNRYDIVLADSDDTILDFRSSCKQALGKALAELGVDCTAQRAYDLYTPMNEGMWHMLNRGEIGREEMFRVREQKFAELLGTTFAPGQFNTIYRAHLRETKFVRPGATDFLKALKARGIRTYIITNADAYCAEERLKPVMPYVDGAFISETMGAQKPTTEYFDKVFDGIGRPDKRRVIVFGDGETSDIAGGIGYGLNTCLYDVSGKAATAADFTAKDYGEFLGLI